MVARGVDYHVEALLLQLLLVRPHAVPDVAPLHQVALELVLVERDQAVQRDVEHLVRYLDVHRLALEEDVLVKVQPGAGREPPHLVLGCPPCAHREELVLRPPLEPDDLVRFAEPVDQVRPRDARPDDRDLQTV